MIRIRQIKIPVSDDTEINYKKKCASRLHIKPSDIKNISIHKKSIDARKKPNIFYVYEFDVETTSEIEILNKNNDKDIFKTVDENYYFPHSGIEKLTKPITIIGSGPAGLFAAYILTENGYPVNIIERGEDVDSRVKTVEQFWDNNILNENSNVQFGEGGAGTFSDGKLNTMVKDPYHRQKKIFDIFIECGAPQEIAYLNKPHIGTDLLRKVIKNMRNKIISNGGTITYNSCLTDLVIKDNHIEKIEINHEQKIDTDILLLALGHSARDTFNMLYKKGLEMKAKPFAVGIRIQHLQKMINDSQYGNINMPPSSYKLTYQAKSGRGVYTFCMCPGGYVVNASSEKNRLAINGMSNYARETENANSAIIVTITPDDFGHHPLDGIEFQRKLEKAAYEIGLGNIPIQLYGDFKKNIKSKSLKEIKPVMKGKYQLSNIREIFSDSICEDIIEAIENFGQKIKGYNKESSIIAAIESRSSSPVKIIRDEFGESNIKGIYPIGEGAGYAGGITSAAMDGLKIAEEIAKKYTNINN